MSEIGVNATKWNRKVKQLQRELGPEITKTVLWGSTQLASAITKNLSGTAYYSGKLPVKVNTGTLRRAYQVNKISPFLMVHFMDPKIAEYAKFVHFGTKYLKPRPFFKNAVNERRQAIMNYFKYQTLKKTREVGRA